MGTKSSTEEEEEVVSVVALGVSLTCMYLLRGPECILLFMCNSKWPNGCEKSQQWVVKGDGTGTVVLSELQCLDALQL